MKKSSIILKISLVMAICLFACLITACGDKVVTTTYEITKEFENIKVDVDTVDVEFLPTKGKCKVECTESKEGKYIAEVIGTELRVRNASSGGFVIGLGAGKEKIKVYLPNKEYKNIVAMSDTGKLDIKDVTCKAVDFDTDTGNIAVKNVQCNRVVLDTDTGYMSVEKTTCKALDVESDTGDLMVKDSSTGMVIIVLDTGKTTFNNVTCESVDIDVDTGDVNLNDVIASGKFDIESDNGSVNFKSCDAGEVFVKTNTGDVKGSFLTDKIIFTTTDTGNVDVPKLTSGTRCEITTDTGDIVITINSQLR